jgi:hypothetical protein
MTPEEAEAIVALLNAQLEHGSDEEKEARRATADILRATVAHVLHTAPDIDASVLDILADLVDPDCPRECPGYIRFEQRREGRPSDTLRDQEIADFIERRRYAETKHGRVKRGAMKNIISDAAQEFGIKERRILGIWRSRRS